MTKEADGDHVTCYDPGHSDRGVVHLHDLDPGDRFRLPYTERTGTLRNVNHGHAIVDFDKGDPVTITKYEGTPEEETVHFERPRNGEVIAACTVAERLEAQDD